MVFCVSLVLLVASGYLNYLLVSKLKTVVLKLQYTRIFPLGFSYRSAGFGERMTSLENAKRPLLIFVGDSRVQMWDTTVLEQKLSIANIGHGGQTSAQIRLQVANYSLPRGE